MKSLYNICACFIYAVVYTIDNILLFLVSQIWDGVESGRCLKVYSTHSGAVRDAHWSPCGRRFFTGSFDSTAMVTDVETGELCS